jgi:translation initiation factor IF-3
VRDNRRDMTMINERIRYGQVRVVDEENNQVGVMETKDALNLARSKDLDLILVAEKAQPPVCRIMDYGKFKYEQSKKKSKTKVAATELKMVRLHPRTGVHDRQILERHAEKFLRHGHKVRVVCQFRGRENAHPEIGRQQLDAIAKSLEEIATVEGAIIKQGRDMTMFIVPKPGLKPLPKVAKESWKAKPASGEPEVEEHDDDELPDEYSAPGVEDHDDDSDDAHADEESNDESDDDSGSDDADAEESDEDESDEDDDSDDEDKTEITAEQTQ